MRRITLLTNPDKCNLNCPLCFLNQRGFSRCVLGVGEMAFETARTAIEKYAADRDVSGRRVLREVIPSTMGEPLLYSYFEDLLSLCRSMELPLNLTTNGTFPGKWGSDAGMAELLRSCSDIKVSYLASEQFESWKANVEKLVSVRDRLREKTDCTGVVGLNAETECAGVAESRVATVSLQVTLHKKNLQDAPGVMSWASAIGIDRIKWNKVVFLSVAPVKLRKEYELGDDDVALLRSRLKSSKVRCQGSLFFTDCRNGNCAMGGVCGESCPFTDEVWVWPDGHEDHCPDPERRFGDKNG